MRLGIEIGEQQTTGELRPTLPIIKNRLSTRERDVEEGWITLDKKGQTMSYLKHQGDNIRKLRELSRRRPY